MILFVGFQQHHTTRNRAAASAAHQRSTPDNVSHVLFIQIRFSHDVYFLSILNWFSVRLPLGRAHIGDAALLQAHLGGQLQQHNRCLRCLDDRDIIPL